MIKKCKAFWKNDAVAVVDFYGIQVQVPAKMMDGDEITLQMDGDSFYIVDEEIEKDESVEMSTEESEEEIAEESEEEIAEESEEDSEEEIEEDSEEEREEDNSNEEELVDDNA